MTLSVSLSLSPSLFLFLSLSRARSVHARFSNVSDKDTAASVPERGAVLRCSASVQGFDPGRCRANMAHRRQSRPDPGLGFQVQVLETFQVVPSSLGSGLCTAPRTLQPPPGPFRVPETQRSRVAETPCYC